MNNLRPTPTLTEADQRRAMAYEMPFAELVEKAEAFAVAFGQFCDGSQDYVVLPSGRTYMTLRLNEPARVHTSTEPITMEGLRELTGPLIGTHYLFAPDAEYPDAVLYYNAMGHLNGLPYNVQALDYAERLGIVPDDLGDGLYGDVVIWGLSSTSWRGANLPQRALSEQ